MWIAIQNAVGARQGVGGGPGPTPPPYTPPLDAYPALAAYSVRKVSSSYSGPCIEIIRTSDSATQEIGFGSDGLVDSTAIQAFCSGTDGLVSKWFDQSSNGNHALQPLGSVYIYTSGVVKTLNGKPALGPLPSSNTLSIPTLTFGGDLSFVSLQGYRNNQMAFGGAPGTFFVYSTTGDFNNVRFRYPGANHDFTVVNQIEQAATLNVSRRSSSVWNLWNQGNLNSFTPTGSASFDLTYLLGGNGGGFPHSGPHQEIIFWNSDLGAAVLEGFNSSMNQYYQISNFPDYTSGFLADYSDAAAAYSVRKLSNTAIKCMRVRRTVAPFDEQDIGFTPAGDLDTAAISTFGGADVLVVSRWYDQSGFSRHAVQISPGFQPQIYNGTSVVTKNGNPALAFGGTHFVAQIDVINQPSTYVSVHDIVTNSGYTYPWSAGNTLQEFTSFGLTQSIAVAGSYLNGPNIDDYMVSSVVFNGTSSIVRTNGTVGITGDTGTNSTGTSLGIGARFTGSNQLVSGSIMQELIVWPTNQTSPTNNLPAIETNINDYYYAYNTSGFVVDYPGAAAAFSVRQLGNRQRYAMQVKRLAGSNDTLDIGFDSNGDLDTQAIIDFGGSDRLGVSFWYDQSGNGKNASQTSLINMPIIYDGSSVITDTNGIPALGRNITGSTFSLGDVLAASAPANATFISVVKGDSNSNIIYNGGGGRSIHSLTTNNNISVFNAGATGIAGSLPATTDTLLAVQVTGTSTTDQGWRNGVFSYSGNSGTLAPKTANLGQATLTGSPVLMQELIVYPSDIDAGGTRTNIETNIMTYYGIP